MYRKILLNIDLSLKERIKRLIAYYFRRRGARIPWKKRFDREYKLRPKLQSPIEKSLEKAHRKYWQRYRANPNLTSFRMSHNISGNIDSKTIPEEIFRCDIEPTLNSVPSVEFLTYKSIYSKWFSSNIFPRDYLHNIDGEWFDADLHSITFQEANEIAKGLEYPVVLKPNKDSYGGKGIYFPKDYSELELSLEKLKNFLVQEKIEQHTFFQSFNGNGLNTIRVNIYRSVKDNKLHILNLALRLGVGGSLDNMSVGGIATEIKSNGYLGGYAVNRYGDKFYSHPDSGLEFDVKVPEFEALQEFALTVASKINYARLVALDICLDSNGKWRMVEINIFGATVKFAQYLGSSFFGEFSDEISNYCQTNHWTLK